MGLPGNTLICVEVMLRSSYCTDHSYYDTFVYISIIPCFLISIMSFCFTHSAPFFSFSLLNANEGCSNDGEKTFHIAGGIMKKGETKNLAKMACYCINVKSGVS